VPGPEMPPGILSMTPLGAGRVQPVHAIEFAPTARPVTMQNLPPCDWRGGGRGRSWITDRQRAAFAFHSNKRGHAHARAKF
jgi:hypothetical protein